MSFSFDRNLHVYMKDGERLLSNTDILGAEGFCDYSDIPEPMRQAALARGRVVHEATHLVDKGKHLAPFFDPYAGYIEAYRRFKKEFGFKPKLREKPLIDPLINVATTPDAFGEAHRGLITVQIKTGKVEPWVALQTAFEERVLALHGYLGKKAVKVAERLVSTTNRYGIELRSDGTYKPTWFSDPHDIKIWMAAYTMRSWKKKYL